MTQQDKFALALKARGLTEVFDRAEKYRVFQRSQTTFYYLGRQGALRIGQNLRTSVPASEEFKHTLLESVEQFHHTGRTSTKMIQV